MRFGRDTYFGTEGVLFVYTVIKLNC